jgi:Flp pilus assembly protein TadD
MTVNIILWLHRGGQIAGATILRDLLETLGCTTRLIITSRDQPGPQFRADVNLFSSELHPLWLPLAKQNLLIPNQEGDVRQSFGRMHQSRFSETTDQLAYLRLLDKLLVKTRHAEQIFRGLGLPASYIGFTCRDRLLPDVPKEKETWLCVMGDSYFNKDILPVVRIWGRNPQFPPLLIVLHNIPPAFEPLLKPLPNVSYRRERLPDDQLRLLQNRCGVHICPSTMEGWGHSIVESMSTGALLLTTGAPPMDEHVNESRGICFGFSARTPHSFGCKFTIDERSLEQAVRCAMDMPPEELIARGRQAREYFLENDRQFRTAFTREWQEMVTPLPFSAGTIRLPPAMSVAGSAPLVHAEISAGELLDKIGILHIKMLRIKDPAKLANIRRELETLEKVRNSQSLNTPQLQALASELEAINASLWQTEDDLRRCEQQRNFGDQFIGFARGVYRLNDRRADIKRRINIATGSRLVEEKDYPGYAKAAKKPAPPVDPHAAVLRRGMDHQRAGDLDAAESCYRSALETNAEHPDALHLLGRLFDQRGNADAAIEEINRAIALKPNAPEFHNSLGLVRGRTGDHAAAEQCFRRALVLRRDYGEAAMNLGIALLQQGKPEQAIEPHRQSVRLQPNRASAHYNLAEALRETCDLSSAVVEYQEAVRHRPGYAEAWNNLGVCHRQLGDTNHALEAFEAALKIKPDFAGAHWNHAMALLFRGDWSAGWEEYEWRWRLPVFEGHAARFPDRLWNGEPLAGKTLLLHAEQGLGDTLQFIRYAPLLAERGAKIVLESQPGLVGLLKGMTCLSRVIAVGAPLPDYDFHAPLLSMPRRFGTTLENVPIQIPYLTARQDLRQKWSQRLEFPEQTLKVGLAWNGSATPDPLRSCPAEELIALIGLPRIQFVSLQRDATDPPPAELNVLDFPESNADMENTAGLIANLDLVLSIDTSIAHLAGALGKPVWTMLPYSPD